MHLTVIKQMADKLGVDLHQTECKFKGECKGTCPKCQQEEEKLNKAMIGKAAVLTGIAVSAMALVACGQSTMPPEDGSSDYSNSVGNSVDDDNVDNNKESDFKNDPNDKNEGVIIEQLEGDVAIDNGDGDDPGYSEVEGEAIEIDDENCGLDDGNDCNSSGDDGEDVSSSSDGDDDIYMLDGDVSYIEDENN